MNDLYTIDTPENVEFAYDIAGIGSRFLAAIIDTMVIIILLFILIFDFLLMTETFFDLGSGTSDIISALFLLAGFAFLWGYYITFEMFWNGQSPGKRALGLRVVREGGRPITFASSAIRNIIRLIDFLPSFYGIGVIAMFIDRRARRLGDLAAGTLVVKERQNVTLDSLLTSSPIATQPTNEGQQLTLPNIELLTPQDYQLIQEFLQRRSELSRDARLRLSVQLGNGIQSRLGLPTGGDSERFLQYVVAQYQLFQRTKEESAFRGQHQEPSTEQQELRTEN